MSETIKTLQQAERDAILAATKVCRNTTEAAKVLGIARATLYRRLKKHGLGKELPDIKITVQTGELND